jgi:copper chaperone CopZ
LPGITQVNVNLAAEKLFVEFDSDVLTVPKIQEKERKGSHD